MYDLLELVTRQSVKGVKDKAKVKCLHGGNLKTEKEHMTYLKLQNLEHYAAKFNANYVKRHRKFNIQNMETCTILNDFFVPICTR